MKIWKGKSLQSSLCCLLLSSVLSSCGNSDDPALSIEDIPRYPGAIVGESLQQTAPGGFMGGKLQQYTTTDTFADVLSFYSDSLAEFEPEYSSFKSELGEQTAITIPKEQGALTVAIQSFEEEGVVSITFMSVGIR